MPSSLKAGTPAPADLGDIVTDAAALCARRSIVLIPMAAVSIAGSALISVGAQPLERYLQRASSAQAALHLPLSNLMFLIPAGYAIWLFSQLAMERFAFDHWAGEGGRAAPAYVAALRRYLAALVASMLTLAVFFLGFATWLGIPLAIYFVVCWAFAGQVCVVEGETNPLRALRRSRAIVFGAWWRSAAVLTAIMLLWLLPSFLADWLSVGRASTGIVLSVIAAAVSMPFLAAAQTRLYIDLRLRKHESIALTPSGPAQPL